MNKTVLVLLLLAFCFGAAACGGQDASYEMVTPEAAMELIEEETDDLVIIDVRSATDYNAAHIENALLVPVDTIGEKAPAQLTDTAMPVLVYCGTGEDSATAAAKLAAMGFKHLYVLEGGLDAWEYDTVPTLSWCPTC